jgi:biotin carboxyl carrier protein
MRVDADAVLCIVEIMKLMNTITAPRPGAVVEVLVGNGEQVERGQALFRIRPDGA